jgi:hypothetical protein
MQILQLYFRGVVYQVESINDLVFKLVLIGGA